MQKSELPAYVEKVLAKKDPAYRELYIPDLNDRQIPVLIELLNKYQNTYINKLSLQCGSVSNEGLVHFVKLPKTVQYVYLCHHNITAGAAPILVEAFSHVIYLDISDNNISSDDAKYLAQHATQHWLNVAGNKDLSEDDRLVVRERTERNETKAKYRDSSSGKLSLATGLRTIGSAKDQQIPNIESLDNRDSSVECIL